MSPSESVAMTLTRKGSVGFKKILARLDKAILSLVRLRRFLCEEQISNHFDQSTSQQLDRCLEMERLLGGRE